MKPKRSKYIPALFIVSACLLWGTDALFRYPASAQWDRSALVFLENLVGLLFLAPIVLFNYGAANLKPKRKDLPLILIVGVGGGAIADLLFTAAIQALGPGTTTVFQMLQPGMVVLFAYLFLRERHNGLFFQCAFWVVLNAIVIAYPNFEFGFVHTSAGGEFKGIFFSLLAMIFWAASTVAGKALLKTYPPMQLVLYRLIGAVAFLGGWVLVQGTKFELGVIFTGPVLLPLLFLAIVPGVCAMIIYYYGLKDLPASIATFVEQTNSVASIVFAAIFFDKALTPVQWLGALTLLLVIFALAGLENAVTIEAPARSRRRAT